MFEKEVFFKNISHIHKWKIEDYEYTLSFSGFFQNGSPVYKYREITNVCRCRVRYFSYEEGEYLDESYVKVCECFDNLYIISKEKSGMWSKKKGKGNYIMSEDKDLYPDTNAFVFLYDIKRKVQFDEAFGKIDFLLDFINVNSDFKNYLPGSINKYKNEILYFILFFRRINSKFPLEMILTVMSFLRNCEIKI